MSKLGFNPVAAQKSFIEELQNSATWEYNPELDPRDDGDFLTSGIPAITYRNSVAPSGATKRGSARLDLVGYDIADLSRVLNHWDPEEDLTALSSSEVARRTLTRQADGTTTFQLSMAKNSRTVRIPAGEWGRFCELMEANANSVEAAVKYYRSVMQASE